MDLVVVVLSQSLLSASHLARAPLQLFDLRVWASRLTLNFKIRQFITTTIRSTLLSSFFTCDSLRVLGICSPVHLQLTTSWPFHAIAQAKISLGISPSKPIMSGLYAQQHVQRHLSYSSAPSLFLWDINSSGMLEKLICIHLYVRKWVTPLWWVSSIDFFLEASRNN